MNMRATKGQLRKIRESNVGYGFLVINVGGGEVTEIEVYVSRDNLLRRVGSGAPLFPIQIIDSEDGPINIKAI